MRKETEVMIHFKMFAGALLCLLVASSNVACASHAPVGGREAIASPPHSSAEPRAATVQAKSDPLECPTRENSLPIPFTYYHGSPFARLPLKTVTGQTTVLALLDTGWSGCPPITASAAAELSLVEDKAKCNGGGYAGIDLGPWHGFDTQRWDFGSRKGSDTEPQRGVLSTDAFREQIVEFDFSSKQLTVFAPPTDGQWGRNIAPTCDNDRANWTRCKNRWQAKSFDIVKLVHYSACDWSVRAQGTEPIVPMTIAKVSGIDGTIEFDTGRDESVPATDVSVNDAFFAVLSAHLKLAPKQAPQLIEPQCEEAIYVASVNSKLELTLGGRTFLLDQIAVRRPKGGSDHCGGFPYSATYPAGLVGMTVLKKLRRLVIDPFGERARLEWL